MCFWTSSGIDKLSLILKFKLIAKGICGLKISINRRYLTCEIFNSLTVDAQHIKYLVEMRVNYKVRV
jgi:hypothetical protein